MKNNEDRRFIKNCHKCGVSCRNNEKVWLAQRTGGELLFYCSFKHWFEDLMFDVENKLEFYQKKERRVNGKASEGPK